MCAGEENMQKKLVEFFCFVLSIQYLLLASESDERVARSDGTFLVVM